MSFSATVDRPEKPRPIFDCLPNAIRAAIRCGTLLSEMNLTRWAQSYPPATEEDVERIYKVELTKSSNANQHGGDGK